MTAEQRDELVRDLERAGVRVVAIEPRPHYPGEWQLRCWRGSPAGAHVITNETLARQAVRDRLTPVLPSGMRPQVRRRRVLLSVLLGLGLLAVLLDALAPIAFPASEPYDGASTAGDYLTAVTTVPNGNTEEAWAVGLDASHRGFILHESGGRWAKVYPLGLAALHSIPSLLGLAMASPVEGWAVGMNGTILHLAGGT